MAQLSDDCFAFGAALLPVDVAVAELRVRLGPVTGIEQVPLHAAVGRILAEDLVAPVDLPPFANSAVDGYALRHADLAPDAETILRVGGRVPAGGALARPIRPGEAIRIFTGAPMPEGADTVMMQEDAVLLPDGRVRLPAGLKRGANARSAGEDVRAGATALPAGRLLRPQDVGMAAALGRDTLAVRTRLRVALFSTGDELAPPGAPLPPLKVYDSNRFTLHAALTRLGCAVTDLGILPDSRAAVAEALAAAAPAHDLLLTSGGVSTGEEDHVKAAVEAAGSLFFWRLAIKPGRPVALGQVGGTAFAGLPGNPVAVVVTFVHIVRPLALLLAGGAAPPPLRFPVRAGFRYRKKAGRREYVRASLATGADGVPEARNFPREGAGLLSSLVETDGLVELGETTTTLAPGETVAFLPFSELL
ncbi:molybdopterin molybdotransferase MoeA [Elioraea sp. Yellowstone]|uniref:molybdopterin molybdotransferase MoeA n=1 Tax=Elioraea sp. Yellowstone TaxID=2592070 RepID=UPI001153596F|nr:gephyrin-like molybdotransferase Glp [Elioraea sp. Yellowstone]TQF82543.1 molybdopterin molybdotransferase MoeA [Elioraea sp. Yellowstone]